MTNVEILEAKMQAASASITQELLEHACLECAIDMMLEAWVSSLKKLPIEVRFKLFASIGCHFDFRTGEEINGPES
jgi:hypothetical protein